MARLGLVSVVVAIAVPSSACPDLGDEAWAAAWRALPVAARERCASAADTASRLSHRRRLAARIVGAKATDASGVDASSSLAADVASLRELEVLAARSKVGILHQHVEKAAGESICELARLNECSTPHALASHCEAEESGDWPVGRDPALPIPCPARPLWALSANYSFASMEKTLPGDGVDVDRAQVCADFLNVLVLREPVARASSACVQFRCAARMRGRLTRKKAFGAANIVDDDSSEPESSTEVSEYLKDEALEEALGIDPLVMCSNQEPRFESFTLRVLLGMGGVKARAAELRRANLLHAALERLELFDAVVTVEGLGSTAPPIFEGALGFKHTHAPRVKPSRNSVIWGKCSRNTLRRMGELHDMNGSRHDFGVAQPAPDGSASSTTSPSSSAATNSTATDPRDEDGLLRRLTELDYQVYRRARELEGLDAAFYQFALALPSPPPPPCVDGCGHICRDSVRMVHSDGAAQPTQTPEVQPSTSDARGGWTPEAALRRLCSNRELPKCLDGSDLTVENPLGWPPLCRDLAAPLCGDAGTLLVPQEQLNPFMVPMEGGPCADSSRPACADRSNRSYPPTIHTMPPECPASAQAPLATCRDGSVPHWAHRPIVTWAAPHWAMPPKGHFRFFYQRYNELFRNGNHKIIRYKETRADGPLTGRPSQLLRLSVSNDEAAGGGVSIQDAMVPTIDQDPRTCPLSPWSWVDCCPSGSEEQAGPCGSEASVPRGACVSTAAWLDNSSRWRDSARVAAYNRSARFGPLPLWALGVSPIKCACHDNFDGLDCALCAPGWRGEACDVRDVLVRRSLGSSNGDVARAMVAEVRRLYGDPEAWMFLKLYHQASDWSDYSIYSLHWHRAFLMWMEKKLLGRTGDAFGAAAAAAADAAASKDGAGGEPTVSHGLVYWNVTDPSEFSLVEELLGYRTVLHLCGNATAQRQCPELLGVADGVDCHCLPDESEIEELVARPCYGPLDDPGCFFAGINHIHLRAHYLTGLGEFGFEFDTTGTVIFWPLHTYLDLLLQRWMDRHGATAANRTWRMSVTKMSAREEAKLTGIAVSEAEVAPHSNLDSMPLLWIGSSRPYVFGDMCVESRELGASLGYSYEFPESWPALPTWTSRGSPLPAVDVLISRLLLSGYLVGAVLAVAICMRKQLFAAGARSLWSRSTSTQELQALNNDEPEEGAKPQACSLSAPRPAARLGS